MSVTSSNLTLLTDLYELTMMQGYFEKQENEMVVFDVFFRNNPCSSGYSICAGLEQIIEYIKNLHFTYEDIEYLRGVGIFSEEFFKEHPEIEEEYKIIQAKQDEGLDLTDRITKIDIDMEKLQFKDLWMELGLDEELCKRIDYLGTSMVGVDGVRENDLSKLYDAVKEKFVGEIKDC